MDKNKLLFDLIKKKDWNKTIEFINENEDLDMNIKDNSSNFMIQYAIIYNQIDLVSILINKGSKLDIIDNDGRSLLYIPIKYNYIKMLELLLFFNKSSIGLSLIDIKDKNKLSAIHYAIMFKNIEIIKLLINAGSNMNIKDKSNNTLTHFSIFTKEIEIIRLIVENSKNINDVSNTGESALHIACNLGLYNVCELLIKKNININITDIDNQFSCINYSISQNNIQITKLLIDSGIDLTNQDYYGNSPLHYTIIDNLETIFDLILEKKINIYNIYNIDLHTPLHIALYNYKNTKNKYFIEKLIKKTDINFLDMKSNSIIHLLCMNDIIFDFKDELKNRKLDIFIKNNEDKYPYEYLNESDLEKFLNIVSENYLYLLKNNKNIEFENEWDNLCKNDINYQKLNKKNKKFLSNEKIQINDNLCINVIKNKIKKIIQTKNITSCIKSFPIRKNKRCIVFDKTESVQFCTYTGLSIDILFGLYYTLTKYKNTCTTLKDIFYINDDVINYYYNNRINLTNNNLLNIQILWIFKRLFFPKNFFEQLKLCLDSKKDYILIPLGIGIKEYGNHSNILLIDLKKKEIERFEPHGSNSPYKFNYNSEMLDNLLKMKLLDVLVDFKYFSPKDYLPKIGIQSLVSGEPEYNNIGDPDGFCSLWIFWYVNLRLKYKEINRNKIIYKVINSIKRNNLLLKDIIRNYSLNITEIRDRIFKNNNININNWLNNNISEDNFKNIKIDINKLFKNIIIS